MLRFITVAVVLLLAGCSLTASDRPPLPMASDVDLERFMGDWYVIGFIPLYPERNAHNGVESYRLTDDGRIATTYRFRDGGFDQPLETYQPEATVVEGSGNAHWKMQFIWPFKAEYLIAYLSDDYSEVIVGRSARDYVWLMAREPNMSAARYSALKQKIADMGYSLEEFKRHPQQWPEFEPRPAVDH